MVAPISRPMTGYGRPGFANVLQAVADAYRDKRSDVAKQAEQIVEHLNQMSSVSDHGHDLTTDLLDGAFRHYRSTFDSQHGGFGKRAQVSTEHGTTFSAALLAADGQLKCA